MRWLILSKQTKKVIQCTCYIMLFLLSVVVVTVVITIVSIVVIIVIIIVFVVVIIVFIVGIVIDIVVFVVVIVIIVFILLVLLLLLLLLFHCLNFLVPKRSTFIVNFIYSVPNTYYIAVLSNFFVQYIVKCNAVNDTLMISIMQALKSPVMR